MVKTETIYGTRNDATSYVTLFFNVALQRVFGLAFFRIKITKVETDKTAYCRKGTTWFSN